MKKNSTRRPGISGYFGARKDVNVWKTRTTIAGIRSTLGYFTTDVEAAQEWNAHQVRKYGNEARLNAVCPLFRPRGENNPKGFVPTPDQFSEHQTAQSHVEDPLTQSPLKTHEQIWFRNKSEGTLYVFVHSGNKNYPGLRRVIFDASLTEAMNYTWTIYNKGYAKTHDPASGKCVPAHHLVMGKPRPGFEWDHNNKDKLDNRKQNLREATSSQNSTNTGPQKNSKSGFKNVYTSKGKWEARLEKEGVVHHLGTHTTKEEAARHANRGMVEYHKEFACLNDVQPLFPTTPIKTKDPVPMFPMAHNIDLSLYHSVYQKEKKYAHA